MVSSHVLQISYNHLYKCLRNYIWPFDVVENIASLEESVYKAIPTISDVALRLNRLKLDCREIMREDSDLNDAFKAFEYKLREQDAYMKLTQPREVITQ